MFGYGSVSILVLRSMAGRAKRRRAARKTKIKSKTVLKLPPLNRPKILSAVRPSIFGLQSSMSLKPWRASPNAWDWLSNAGERDEGRRGRLHDRADTSPRRHKCDTAASTGAEGGAWGPRGKRTRNYVWLWQCQHSRLAQDGGPREAPACRAEPHSSQDTTTRR